MPRQTETESMIDAIEEGFEILCQGRIEQELIELEALAAE
jgi:hypothetical protein